MEIKQKIFDFVAKKETKASIKDFILTSIIGYQLGYFFFDYIGHHYVHYVAPFDNLGFGSWEPMAGVSIGLVYIYGINFFPFIFLCPIVSEMIFGTENMSGIILIVSEISSATCYILISYLLRYSPQFDPRLRTVEDIFLLLLITSGVTLMNTTEHIWSIYHSEIISADKILSAYWRHYVGELSGILSTLPIILLFVFSRPWQSLTRTNGIQAILILIFNIIIFGYTDSAVFQLFYLLFLPSIWVALLSGPQGSALTLLYVQVIALVGCEVRFGSDIGRGSVQALIIALAATILLVSAVVAEKDDASKRLREKETALNRTLRIKATGETAATLAHEINQPLTALKTYIDLLKDTITDQNNPKNINLVSLIEKECDRIISVIRGIRSLFKKEKLVFTKISLQSLIEETLDMLRSEVQKAQCYLSIIFGKPEISIIGDKVQLQQAIINLVINSCEALMSIKRTGKIEISCQSIPGSHCTIEVRDDGPGFPEEYNTNELSAFTSSKEEGSGLGLMIVKSIVEIHGGNLKIHSSKNGSLVKISLPLST